MLALSSCGLVKKKQTQEKIDLVHHKDLVAINEARLVDVPIPFDAVWSFAYDYGVSGGYFASYKISHNSVGADSLVTYYQSEMESAGWGNGIYMCHDHNDINHEIPVILIFQKPHKMCIVTMYDNACVTLLLAPKTNITLE